MGLELWLKKFPKKGRIQWQKNIITKYMAIQVYWNQKKIKHLFSEPDAGINKDTGILLFISGFGGNANSNVYEKMRSLFADKYNLVTVQCDHFGWEFMQGSNNIDLNVNKEELEKILSKEEIEYIYQDDNIFERLMKIAGNNKLKVSAKEKLEESFDNYNDMGLVQALDNISAVISVIEIIKDNGFKFNEDKIILYGNSHGSYLSYLCNALSPSLFSLLIDNSSWLFPVYLKSNRYLNSMYGNATLSVEFDYLAKKTNYDEEILSLSSLYKKFDNECNIICYHGTSDNLICHRDKVKLKNVINNFRYIEIDNNKVDGLIFKSNQHGLNADFLDLFDYTINNFKFRNKKNRKIEDVTYETKKNKYEVSYSQILPILTVDNK